MSNFDEPDFIQNFMSDNDSNTFKAPLELEKDHYFEKLKKVRSNFNNFNFTPSILKPDSNKIFITKVRNFEDCKKIEDTFAWKNNYHREFVHYEPKLIKRTFVVNNSRNKISVQQLVKLSYFLAVDSDFVVIVHYLGDISLLTRFTTTVHNEIKLFKKRYRSQKKKIISTGNEIEAGCYENDNGENQNENSSQDNFDMNDDHEESSSNYMDNNEDKFEVSLTVGKNDSFAIDEDVNRSENSFLKNGKNKMIRAKRIYKSDRKNYGINSKKICSQSKKKISNEYDDESLTFSLDNEQAENYLIDSNFIRETNEIQAIRLLIYSGLNFLRKFEINSSTGPTILLTFYANEVIDFVNLMIKSFKDQQMIRFSINTTHLLTNNYVTFLSTKNLLLKEQPPLMICGFVHKEKTNSDYQWFLDQIVKLIHFERNCFCTTNLEKSIIESVQKILGENLVFSADQISDDIDCFCKKQVEIYNNKINNLLENSEEKSIFYNSEYDLKIANDEIDESNQKKEGPIIKNHENVYSISQPNSYTIDQLKDFIIEIQKFRRESKESFFITDSESFESYYELHRMSWNRLCLNYYDNCIYLAIQNNIQVFRRLKLDQEKLFEPINLSERLSSMIKRWLNYSEKLSLDDLAFQMYKFQVDQVDEHNKSLQCIGTYNAKNEFKNDESFLINFKFDEKIFDNVQRLRQQFVCYSLLNNLSTKKYT